VIPQPKTLYWLIGEKAGRRVTLGFVANEDRGGLVLGGPTGTHCTGHGEGWRSKWAEIEAAGYREAPADGWKAPRISRKDRVLLKLWME
jgi:hypothetical protein